MNFNRIRNVRKALNPTGDNTSVYDGIIYWFNKLLDICMDMFVYDGLPDTLPAREIETNLLLQDTGHALIFYTPQHGIITCWSELYGYDIYYKPTNATYSQPVLGSGTLTIGEDCEVIYNNRLESGYYTFNSDGGLRSFILRYARQLADIDSTIAIYTINQRATEYPIAKNERTKQSIKEFFTKLKEGTTDIIVDDFILEAFKSVSRSRDLSGDKINDWLIAKDKILEQFFRDLGIRFYNPKKAQVSDDEVNANTQLLVVNTDDMLTARREGIERVNRHYGTNIMVSLNDKFDITKYVGGVNNGNIV